MPDQTRVNGNAVSWGSIVVKVDGERFHGFTAVSYADKRERVKGHGMGRHHAPGRRSRGKYTVEPVKLTGFKSSLQELRNSLAARSATGTSYGDVEFEIVVQYTEADELGMVVELERCVMTGNTTSEEENPDPLKEEVEIDCMKIIRNGTVLFDDSQGSP